MIGRTFKLRLIKIINLVFIIVLILGCSEHFTEPFNSTENKMYVYSNFGRTFYIVDYKTFEVVQEIQLDIVDTVSYQGMILSTNRDFLFFKVGGLNPSSPFGFVIYDIKKEKSDYIFFTEFKNPGPAYFISALNKSEPGLIYIHFRDIGTYSIDLFDRKIKKFISDEHDFDLDKRIYHLPDMWTVIKKNWAVGYTELEFYTFNSVLQNLQFVLNKNDKDNISIYDFEFSKDNRLFITFQLSEGLSRNGESYFGSYNMETLDLFRSSIKFPWSLTPYYTAISPKRNEIYTMGATNKFYIIDTDFYTIKDSVTITDKINGSCQILITPNEEISFVACPNNNSIFVIDLNSRKIIKIISIKEPYNMIIPNN